MIFPRTEAFLAEKSWSPWRSDNPERFLFHYTTAVGLHGIVKSRTLRLTHTRHLNDETEGLHGAKAFSQALSLLHRERPSSALIANLDQAFQTALSVDTLKVDGGTFVACFSTEGDSLPQWRGYGASDTSFSICWDASALLSHIGRERKTPCWLLPVQYDWDAFVRNVSDALTIAEEEFNEQLPEHEPERLLSSLIYRVANYGSALKHHSFKEESEWRLICFKRPFDTSPPIHHAPTSTLRPYVELVLSDDFLRQALKGVIVGPQSRQDAVIHGVWSFLKTELGIEIPVTRSEVPYRLLG